jgi:hypothetical protein
VYKSTGLNTAAEHPCIILAKINHNIEEALKYIILVHKNKAIHDSRTCFLHLFPENVLRIGDINILVIAYADTVTPSNSPVTPKFVR